MCYTILQSLFGGYPSDLPELLSPETAFTLDVGVSIPIDEPRKKLLEMVINNNYNIQGVPGIDWLNWTIELSSAEFSE